MTERPHGVYRNVSFSLYGQGFDGAILSFEVPLSFEAFCIAKKICRSFSNLHPGEVGEYCFYMTDRMIGFESGRCSSCGYYARSHVTEFEKRWHLCDDCFTEYNISSTKILVFQIIDSINHYQENGSSCSSQSINIEE